MDGENLTVLPLHKVPELMLPCCKLLNAEWPRSEDIRLRSLQCSNDNLPTSLVLVGRQRVIGHCKLTGIPTEPNACFVESVVIAKDFRGLGLGTYLMRKADEYCRTVLNLTTMYLSTMGQERFYEKLGYSECDPISIYGCPLISNGSLFEQEDDFKPDNGDIVVNGNCPPPPPMPIYIPVNIKIITKKTYMTKKIQCQ